MTNSSLLRDIVTGLAVGALLATGFSLVQAGAARDRVHAQVVGAEPSEQNAMTASNETRSATEGVEP